MEDNKLFTEFPPVSTEKWEEVINKDLKGADYEKKLVWKTIEGFKVKPYYRAEDLENIEYLNSNPAQFPFTRGKQADSNVWDVRQDIKEKDPAKANAYALDAVKRGATAVGFCAKEIADEAAMATLLKDIYLTAVSIHFNCSKDFLATMKLFVAVARKNGFDTTQIKGSVNFDPFRYALTHGAFKKGEEGDLREAIELINYAKENLPAFRVLTVNGNLLNNAESTVVYVTPTDGQTHRYGLRRRHRGKEHRLQFRHRRQLLHGNCQDSCRPSAVEQSRRTVQAKMRLCLQGLYTYNVVDMEQVHLRSLRQYAAYHHRDHERRHRRSRFDIHHTVRHPLQGGRRFQLSYCPQPAAASQRGVLSRQDCGPCSRKLLYRESHRFHSTVCMAAVPRHRGTQRFLRSTA